MNRGPRYAIVIIVILAVLIPIILMVFWSFTDTWKYPHLMPSLTTSYWDHFLGTSRWIKPLMNSIILSLVVTVISFALGFLPAKYLGTKDFKGKRIIQVFVMLPALAPGIAVVFGMLPVFVDLGIYRTFESLVIGQIVFTLPYMILTLTAVFKNYDTDYEAQSVTLGVDKIDTALNVTLPSIKSAAAIGCMYTFMVSWSMYLFVSIYRPVGFSTLLTELFPVISDGMTATQDIAIATILFILPSLLFLIGTTLIIKSDNHNERGGPL